MMRGFFFAVFLFCILLGGNAGTTNLAHPRLYFKADDLPRLRQLRKEKIHAPIWKNLMESADWCLTKTPRQNWIAPVSPDPIYENLYDRFYGIMGDLAITEHLAFAGALSGENKYGDAARQWVLASCRVWKNEANGTPDGGKAYAVSRLLKGISVGYDAAYDRFTEPERNEIRETLARIGKLYFESYFQTPTISGAGFCTHHAVVEWSSFGVMSLALLGEIPEAEVWLEETIKKFERDLLPNGLAGDGAQVEGATFWASTMHYRLFFMDACRRVIGRDLFVQFEKQMNADLALASIATRKKPGYDHDNANIVLEPYYGQLDYYSPVLLALAREYRRPIFQYLALWDESLGNLQKTRAITPHGEQLHFELGGYAYLWCDESVPARADSEKFSYHFPSIDEGYLRASWQPNDIVVGARKGQLSVHAGGQPVLVETGISEPTVGLSISKLEDSGEFATLFCGKEKTNAMTVSLNRAEHKAIIERRVPRTWKWWCHGLPTHRGNELTWKNRARLRVLEGKISEFDSTGYQPLFATGFNKLKLLDPAPMKFPQIKIEPSATGKIVVEIQVLDKKILKSNSKNR